MNKTWYIAKPSIIRKGLAEISDEGLDYRFREITSTSVSLISMLTLIIVLAGFDMTLQNIDLSTRSNHTDLQYSVLSDTKAYKEATDAEKLDYLNSFSDYFENIIGNADKNTPSLIDRVMDYNTTLAKIVVVIFLYMFFLKKARLKAIYDEIEERELVDK